MSKISSRVRFKVKSSPSYIVNLLAKEGITIRDIEREGSYVIFSVSEAENKKTINILQGYSREYEVTAKSGAVYFIRDMLKRIGIWTALIVVFISGCIYSFYSMDVKINGLNRLDSETIRQVIADNSIKFPIAKKDIDIEKLKEDIINLQGVSLCDIRLRGHLIEINILEELPKPSILEIALDKPVVSKYDALVTRVVVLSGTPQVAKGDSVKAGSTLIKPYYTLGDNQDVKVHSGASGYVYGRVWYTKSYIFNDTIVEVKRTDKVQRKVSFQFPFFTVKKNCTFEIYEQENIESIIYCPFPVIISQATYYQLEKVERAFVFEAEKDAILEKAYSELDALLPPDAQASRKWYIVKTLDKTTVLDIYYEIEQIISD